MLENKRFSAPSVKYLFRCTITFEKKRTYPILGTTLIYFMHKELLLGDTPRFKDLNCVLPKSQDCRQCVWDLDLPLQIHEIRGKGRIEGIVGFTRYKMCPGTIPWLRNYRVLCRIKLTVGLYFKMQLDWNPMKNLIKSIIYL